MKATKSSSPIKQNVGTDCQSSPQKSQRFQVETIRELLGIMNSNGIVLPPNIQKRIKASDYQSIKLKSVPSGSSSGDQLKKTKIKLNDLEFERKKIEEDFAQFKLLSRQDKEKQLKKWEDMVMQLRQSNEDSSDNSSYKITLLKNAAEKELGQLKLKHQAILKQEKQNLVCSYEDKLDKLKMIHHRELVENIEVRDKKLASQELTAERNIEELQKRHGAEVKIIHQKHKANVQAKEQQYDSRITAAISEKKTEEKMHQQTKMDTAQAKEKLFNQLYYEKRARNEVEDEVQARCKDIREYKRKIEELELTIKLKQQKYDKKAAEISENHAEEIEKIHIDYRETIRNIKNGQKLELEKYQKRLQQLFIIHEQRERVWIDQTKGMASKFEDRPSKKEDLETIQKQRAKIFKKDEEIKHLNKELKHCILELENKEDTYNRIFTSATKIEKTTSFADKKSLAKDDRLAKETLFRKSQTTDFKFLLKVYNKHF